jgi:hypothetical protein
VFGGDDDEDGFFFFFGFRNLKKLSGELAKEGRNKIRFFKKPFGLDLAGHGHYCTVIMILQYLFN